MTSFMAMNKDDLLLFYETLFDSKNIGVYNLDGSVIVESYNSEMPSSTQRTGENQANWKPCKCWESVWNAQNGCSPCCALANNQCMVYKPECCNP